MKNHEKLEHECLIHRYLYYVLGKPILSDYEYDRLEEQAIEALEDANVEESPMYYPGSSLEESYSKDIISEALELLP